MNNTTSLTKMHHEMAKLRERAEKAEAELQKLREREAKQKPVAMVDAGDDGYFAEILPDCSVGVGDMLYAFPPLNVDPVAAPAVALEVWFGPMSESNGKTNWTAILHRGDITQGITIERSEYKDRVRYEADRMRWMIGVLEEEPDILQYDADLHSGYKTSAVPAPSVPEEWREAAQRLIDAAGDKTCSSLRCNYPMDCCSHELIGAMDAMSALLQSADHSEKSLEMVTPEFCNSAKDSGV